VCVCAEEYHWIIIIRPNLSAASPKFIPPPPHVHPPFSMPSGCFSHGARSPYTHFGLRDAYLHINCRIPANISIPTSAPAATAAVVSSRHVAVRVVSKVLRRKTRAVLGGGAHSPRDYIPRATRTTRRGSKNARHRLFVHRDVSYARPLVRFLRV